MHDLFKDSIKSYEQMAKSRRPAHLSTGLGITLEQIGYVLSSRKPIGTQNVDCRGAGKITFVCINLKFQFIIRERWQNKCVFWCHVITWINVDLLSIGNSRMNDNKWNKNYNFLFEERYLKLSSAWKWVPFYWGIEMLSFLVCTDTQKDFYSR